MKRTGNRNKNVRKFIPAARIVFAASILLIIVLLVQFGAKAIDEKGAIETKQETIHVPADNTASAADLSSQTVGIFTALNAKAADTQTIVKEGITGKEIEETETPKADTIKEETVEAESEETDASDIDYMVTDYAITVYENVKNYYSNDRVNIRSGAGIMFDRLDTISRDSKVEVLGETDNGWYQVKHDDEVGYIKMDYLQEEEPGTEYIFAGDSRTVQMSQAVDKDDYEWIAKVGEGFSFFSNEAVPKIDAEAGSGSTIIINYGVNDLYNAEKYIKLINKKVDSWIAAGATVYYAAVTPVSDYPTITNSDIEEFNSEMKSGLDSRIGWLDGYSYLQNKGFSSGDGLHYNSDTYKTLYTYYMNQVAAQKEA